MVDFEKEGVDFFLSAYRNGLGLERFSFLGDVRRGSEAFPRSFEEETPLKMWRVRQTKTIRFTGGEKWMEQCSVPPPKGGMPEGF